MLETKVNKKSNINSLICFLDFGATCVVHENGNWWKEVNVR